MAVGVIYVLFLVILAVALLPMIFFLLTLRNLLRQVSPQNQVMTPNSVWLNLIPLFGTIWMFVTIVRVRDSVSAEFRSRGLAPAGDFGFGVGIAYAILMLFAGIPGMVCWIIYWVKIADLKTQLAQSQPALSQTTSPQGPSQWAPAQQKPQPWSQPQPQPQPQHRPVVPGAGLPGWSGSAAATSPKPPAPMTTPGLGSGPAGAPKSPETTVGLGASAAVTGGSAFVPDRIAAAFVRSGEAEDTPPVGSAAKPAAAEAPGPPAGFDGVAPLRLVMLGGAGKGGDSWTLPRGREVHVGRDESCFISLNDGKCSRKHAALIHKADGLYVTDLGSSNGTRINEERLGAEPRKASAGDKIRFGDTIVEVTA